MIQRQQTLWLLLATICGILSFMFPFATGEELVENSTMRRLKELVAGEDFFILILTIASIGISAVTIFLFKDRKIQKRLCLLGIVISVGILVLYIFAMNKLISSTPALWAVLPVFIILSFYFAFINIRKDERLIKSLDKLR